jgi:hypothetical protein
LPIFLLSILPVWCCINTVSSQDARLDVRDFLAVLRVPMEHQRFAADIGAGERQAKVVLLVHPGTVHRAAIGAVQVREIPQD